MRLNGDFISDTIWYSLPGLTHSYGKVPLIETYNRIHHTSSGTKMGALAYGHSMIWQFEGYGYQAGLEGKLINVIIINIHSLY